MSDYPGFAFIQARWQYGGFPGGYPKYLMAHSLECRHMRGIARSLAGIPGVGGWMQDPNEQHSVQTMTDPSEGVQVVHNSIVALHCGGGNNKALGNEHTGYTADDVATWNSPDALTMLRTSAKNFAWQWVHVIMPLNGVTYLPEWLSLAQIADGSLCGLITHNDSRIVFGGTSHTDPGPNFQYQKLRDWIHAEIRVLLGIVPPPPPPEEGFLMALSDADQNEVRDNLRWLRGQLEHGTAPGQTSIGTTIAALLPQMQAVGNKTDIIKRQIDVLTNTTNGIVTTVSTTAKVVGGLHPGPVV